MIISRRCLFKGLAAIGAFVAFVVIVAAAPRPKPKPRPKPYILTGHDPAAPLDAGTALEVQWQFSLPGPQYG